MMISIIIWNMTLTCFVYFHSADTKSGEEKINSNEELINPNEERGAGDITEGIYPTLPDERESEDSNKHLGRCLMRITGVPWGITGVSLGNHR